MDEKLIIKNKPFFIKGNLGMNVNFHINDSIKKRTNDIYPF